MFRTLLEHQKRADWCNQRDWIRVDAQQPVAMYEVIKLQIIFACGVTLYMIFLDLTIYLTPLSDPPSYAKAAVAGRNQVQGVNSISETEPAGASAASESVRWLKTISFPLVFVVSAFPLFALLMHFDIDALSWDAFKYQLQRLALPFVLL